MNGLRHILLTLRSHLDGLDEAGVRQLPVTRKEVWSEKRAEVKRDEVRGVPPPPPPSPPPAPSLPPPPTPRPAAAPPPPPMPVRRVVWLRCTRLADCGDTLSADSTAILLLCDHDELRDRNRTLLAEMLKAIGYRLPDDAQTLAQPADLAGKGARILCLGNPALLALDPHGMDLGIVRGMWQQTPWGRMLASYPPSYLHDNPPGKKAIWLDLQNLLKDLKLGLPPRTR